MGSASNLDIWDDEVFVTLMGGAGIVYRRPPWQVLLMSGRWDKNDAYVDTGWSKAISD